MSEDSNQLKFESAAQALTSGAAIVSAGGTSPGANVADLDINELIYQYERAVYLHSGVATMESLCKLAGALAELQGTGLIEYKGNFETLRRAYTRIAAAVTAHAASPKLVCSADQFLELARRKLVLETIFVVSGFSSPDHLIMLRGSPVPGGGFTVTSEQAAFLALFFSLDNVPDSLFNTVLAFPPRMRVPITLAWVAQSKVMTVEGEKRRGTVLTGFHFDTSVEIRDELTLSVVQAWMHCSYADHPSKHDFKQELNKYWERMAKAAALNSSFERRRGLVKPTLLILAERMTSMHAMHRCYGHLFAKLKSRFHTVLFVRKGLYTQDLDSLFDEIQVLETDIAARALMGKIVKVRPDLIYFPSIGMSDWTQLVLSVRMAPIQFMTVGHPAPACSKNIDYVVVQRSHRAGAATVGDRVVVRRTNGAYVPHPGLPASIDPSPMTTSSFVNIAVSAMAMKLSPRFLDVCAEIEVNSKRPVYFHFFPSVPGVWMDNVKWSIKKRFKNSTVYNAMEYSTYISCLAGCDLALSPFPFGNTNTAVDYCVAGVPFIAYFSEEVLSMCDRDVMELVGVPDWLLNRTPESYVEAALRLIQDDEIRRALHNVLASEATRIALFGRQDQDAQDFVETVSWIYDRHEELMVRERAVYEVGSTTPIEA